MPSEKTAKIADLLPDPRNANRGTARGAAMIEQSLRACGAGRSILIDKNGKIIAGNKTAENAAAVGIHDLQVIESDGTRLIAVQRTDLDLDTDPRAKEIALLDNRSAEVNLDWDADIIAAFADDGLDLSAMFSDAEMSELISGAEDSSATASAPEDFAEVDESLETAYQCPKCGYEWSGQPK